jgi:predicted small secreted protein
MRPRKANAVARQRGFDRVLQLAALVVLTALALSGCNTVSGVGEDIGAAGGAIDQTSERTQEELTGEEQQSDYQAGRY